MESQTTCFQMGPGQVCNPVTQAQQNYVRCTPTPPKWISKSETMRASNAKSRAVDSVWKIDGRIDGRIEFGLGHALAGIHS